MADGIGLLKNAQTKMEREWMARELFSLGHCSGYYGGLSKAGERRATEIIEALSTAASPLLYEATVAAKALLDYMHQANAGCADEEAQLKLAGTLVDLGYKMGADTYAEFVDRKLTAAIAAPDGEGK